MNHRHLRLVDRVIPTQRKAALDLLLGDVIADGAGEIVGYAHVTTDTVALRVKWRDQLIYTVVVNPSLIFTVYQ